MRASQRADLESERSPVGPAGGRFSCKRNGRFPIPIAWLTLDAVEHDKTVDDDLSADQKRQLRAIVEGW